MGAILPDECGVRVEHHRVVYDREGLFGQLGATKRRESSARFANGVADRQR